MANLKDSLDVKGVEAGIEAIAAEANDKLRRLVKEALTGLAEIRSAAAAVVSGGGSTDLERLLRLVTSSRTAFIKEFDIPPSLTGGAPQRIAGLRLQLAYANSCEQFIDLHGYAFYRQDPPIETPPGRYRALVFLMPIS